MQQESRLIKKEEDEMLKYAFVPKTVQKLYAFRYRGYADEIPFMFVRNLSDRKVTSYVGEFITELIFHIDGRDVPCKKGDWIVVSEKGTQILTDQEFESAYIRLSDLNNQN